jgi:hypothetical protein
VLLLCLHGRLLALAPVVLQLLKAGLVLLMHVLRWVQEGVLV